MNYLELLDKELKETDWDIEHKKRYLYLRSCQLFSFDTRMPIVDPENAIFSNGFVDEVKNSKAIFEELRSKEIDLENVTDRKVTCFSWSKAYTTLVNELLGLHAFCAEDKRGTHAWAEMGHKIDATEQSDLARVKMNLATYGYNLSTNEELYIPDKESSSKIKQIDQDISYIGKEYVNFEKIFSAYKLQILSSKKRFFLLKKEIVTSKKLDDLYNKWITKLIEIYRSYQGILLDFEDASYCLAYLFIYLYRVSGLKLKVVSSVLFLDNNLDDWEFADIYRVLYNKKEYWYLLKKAKLGYEFKEITLEEVHHYLSTYKGDKSLLLKQTL